jgi:hypothetical protein
LFLHELDLDQVEFEHGVRGSDPRGGLEIVLGLGPLLLLAIDRGAKNVGARAVRIQLDGLGEIIQGAIHVVGVHLLNRVGDHFLRGIRWERSGWRAEVGAAAGAVERGVGLLGAAGRGESGAEAQSGKGQIGGNVRTWSATL